MRSHSLGSVVVVVGFVLASGFVGCGDSPEPAPEAAVEPAPEVADAMPAPDAATLASRAQQIFGVLPASAENPANPATDEKIALGRMLYYDARLSKNQDISCNSCHQLDRFGVDGEATSPGHRGQRGDRNSPTVYNAALHTTQFWDGREPDVEAQAKGPVLNPVEMAMPDAGAVETLLTSIPGYVEAFGKAFPESEAPVSFDNMALAIAAFERRLLTPGRFDAFLGGQQDALGEAELAGLELFLNTGCITCHNGAALGGNSFQKLGAVKPYPTEDEGRAKVTGDEGQKFFFKVPSLRNISQTGPYFHDGSVKTLSDAVRLMADHQLGKALSDGEVASIVTFLGALDGEVDAAFVALPELPENGPDTPAPDPS